MTSKVAVLKRWFIPFSLLIYCALISLHGYHYADGDASETSASALHLSDRTLYQGDLYIGHASESKLNERYPFVLLLKFFGASSPWSYLLLHFLCTMLVIAAIYFLGGLFLSHLASIFLLVIACLFVTYSYTLGENEIWYNYVMPSLPAKALGACALLLYLVDRRLWAYSLLIPASLFQPIAGAQLALLFLLLDLWHYYDMRRWSIAFFMPPLLYGCTAGLWILLVYLEQTQTATEVSDRRFFEIMELRLGHHFFPSYYPYSRWIAMTGLLSLALVIWSKRSVTLFRLTILCIGGYIIYTIGVEMLSIPSLLVLQWFKTTVWMKVIGLLAIVHWLEPHLKALGRSWLPYAICTAVALAVFSPLVFRETFFKKPYHLPWVESPTPALQLAQKVKDICPKNASIITPPEMTEIRYFAQRGVFIDYKSNIHSRDYLAQSQMRRERIYGLTLELKRSGRDVSKAMMEHYRGLTLADILVWKSAGATHIITYADSDLDLVSLYSNNLYSLLEL